MTSVTNPASIFDMRQINSCQDALRLHSRATTAAAPGSWCLGFETALAQILLLRRQCTLLNAQILLHRVHIHMEPYCWTPACGLRGRKLATPDTVCHKKMDPASVFQSSLYHTIPAQLLRTAGVQGRAAWRRRLEHNGSGASCHLAVSINRGVLFVGVFVSDDKSPTISGPDLGH